MRDSAQKCFLKLQAPLELITDYDRRSESRAGIRGRLLRYLRQGPRYPPTQSGRGKLRGDSGGWLFSSEADIFDLGVPRALCHIAGFDVDYFLSFFVACRPGVQDIFARLEHKGVPLA